MEELLEIIISFSNDNLFILIVFFILFSNTILPGSLIIIFFITTLGLLKGILLSYLVLVSAICLPYLLMRYFKFDIDRYLNKEYEYIKDKIVDKNPYKSILFIRLTFIPFVAQNILTSIVKVSFFEFILLSIIGLTPSLLLIAFFTEAILNFQIPLLVASILLFIVLNYFFHRAYKKFIS